MKTETGAASRLIAAVPSTILALVVALATTSTAPAGANTGGIQHGDTIQVAANPLEAASLGFASAVARGAEADLSRFLVAEGIRLQLDGPTHAGISSRQAVASLRELLRDFDGGQTRVSRVTRVDGSPDRGFAEVLWTARAAGTSDDVHLTLFLGLLRDREDWRVDEVRLLR